MDWLSRELSREWRQNIAIPLTKLARDVVTVSAAQAQLEKLSASLEKVVDVTEEVQSKRGKTWVDDLSIWKTDDSDDVDQGARRLREMAVNMGEELGDIGTWLNSGEPFSSIYFSSLVVHFSPSTGLLFLGKTSGRFQHKKGLGWNA